MTRRQANQGHCRGDEVFIGATLALTTGGLAIVEIDFQEGVDATREDVSGMFPPSFSPDAALGVDVQARKHLPTAQ